MRTYVAPSSSAKASWWAHGPEAPEVPLHSSEPTRSTKFRSVPSKPHS